MRVSHLVDSLAPGGAERSLVDLIPHLRAEGVDVSITVLTDRGGLSLEAREAGAEVTVLGPGRFDQRVRRMRDLLAEDRPDLLHTTLFGANVVGRVAARLVGTPIVSSLVNTPYGPDHLATPGISVTRLRLAQGIDAATARLVTRFHANASHVATTMARRLHVPLDRIDVIPRGRDPAVLGERTAARGLATRNRLGVGPDAVLVVSLARHEHQKGLDVLLRAVPEVLTRLPAARFMVAGREGNVSSELSRLVSSLEIGAAVELLGARDDVGDLLSAADVFVLPSRREGFPGAVVEAMALRAPIVATHLPGTREALDERNGLLVSPEDVAGLADAIVRVVEEPEAATARVERAHRRFVERFTTGAVAQDMAAFYERVLVVGRRRTGSGLR